MNITRHWAFYRRVQYGTGFGIFWICIFALVYMTQFYNPSNCLDGRQNGDERGVDCGGACALICAFDVTEPHVQWARSFRVTEGQYNAVAYIENKNIAAGSPEAAYTMSLYDAQGLITQRTGSTILPPDSVSPVFEARIDTQGRIPTQTILVLEDITLWVEAASSREQFTVQSRELSGADLRPRLDARIYNEALTEMLEVEVVATIFDAQGNALTSSRTYIDKFAPRSVETAVFTWPEPIAKTLRSCDVPTDVLLAIDLSGSMNNDGDTPPQPITSVLAAAESFTSRLQNGDQASLVTFATDAVINNPLTGNVTSVAASIAALTIDPEEETGSTNTGDALYRGGEELTSVRHNGEARKILVLLTDGLATAPDQEPEQYALDAAAKVKEQGINIFTIGLGEKVNMDFVSQLSSSPDQAYAAVSTADVDRIYRSITGKICEDGAAIIEIIPKTDASFTALD
ncbi:MAG: Mg-chelatase subunit ChlD [Acidimicrobiales bacterium]|jgi:Mg-chelatase subunit ChlD